LHDNSDDFRVLQDSDFIAAEFDEFVLD